MPIRADVLPSVSGRVINMTNVNGTDGAHPFEVGVLPYTVGAIQIKNVQDTSWATGTLIAEVSADGLNWTACPSWVGLTSSTISADGLYGPLDLSGVAFFRLRVNAAESTLYVRAWFVGKGVL